MAYTFQQLVDFAKQGGFPADVAPTMAAIAFAESSGNDVVQKGQPYKTTGWGLWQITPGNSVASVGTDRALLDPVTNARAAYAKYRTQGLRAWTTYNTGAYKKYLNGAGQSGSTGASAVTGATAGATGAGDPFSGVASALGNIGNSIKGISALAETAQKLALPQTWVRIMAGVFGAGLVGFGVVMLTREVRN